MSSDSESSSNSTTEENAELDPNNTTLDLQRCHPSEIIEVLNMRTPPVIIKQCDECKKFCGTVRYVEFHGLRDAEDSILALGHHCCLRVCTQTICVAINRNSRFYCDQFAYLHNNCFEASRPRIGQLRLPRKRGRKPKKSTLPFLKESTHFLSVDTFNH